MANRASLEEAIEILREVMEEVLKLDPSGAAIMRTAYSVIYSESRPLPVIVPPSVVVPPSSRTWATGTVEVEAELSPAASSSGSSSIGKPTVEPIAVKPAVKTTKAKPATEPKTTKARFANKQKADAPRSMKHDSESDSDLFVGQFVSLLEPDIVKNIAKASAIPSTPTPKTKKRKAEMKAPAEGGSEKKAPAEGGSEKKAPAEGGSEKKKRKVEVEYDPYEEIDRIAEGKQSPTQAASFTSFQLPNTPVKGRIAPLKGRKK